MKEKHLVCQGAICKCQFGTTPDKLVVKTQSKRYINDKEGLSKLTATNVDIGSTFDKNTFGSCAKMNNNPCVPVVKKWEGYYDKITVVDNGGKALLEDSKATCAVSGTPSIEIIFHGQTAEPNLQNVNNVRPEVLAHLMPFVEEKLNGYYYNYNGTYEGNITNQKKGNANDVYACNGKGNEEGDFLNAKKLKITHDDFQRVGDVIIKEAGKDDLIELKCIAFTSHNRSVKAGKLWKDILASSYSSVPVKDKLNDKNIDSKSKHTRMAMISVLINENDITNGAEYWDGTDFLAWGTTEETPYKTLGHAKFRQYKFIEIPKAIYEKFIAAHSSQSIYTIKSKNKHDPKNDPGEHEHIIKLDKNGNSIDKARYPVPSTIFKDSKNWRTGNFYYETGVKEVNGISGTITAGESIFWKLTPNKLL